MKLLKSKIWVIKLTYRKTNMPTRVQRDFSLQAGVYFQQKFYMNTYKMTLYMTVETEDIREQNVAIERIKCFFQEGINNSIFIEETETDLISKYRDAELKVCTLPEEPFDQIICIAIMQKLNSILEHRMIVHSINFGSDLSDNVFFNISIEDPVGPFDDHGWWAESNMNISTTTKKSKKDKVVKLIKNNDWVDFGLNWDNKKGINSEILFTSDIAKT